MAISNTTSGTNRIVSSLSSIYEQYGYTQYKMSKFEEYDMYVRNKDFLISSNIITFTDPNGKLMALKPDVTLSIIKNGTDRVSALQKVYYNENVYRIPSGSTSFRELIQSGIECIGDLDDYCIYEVLLLAVKSLENISTNYILDVSNMGVIDEIISSLGLSDDKRKHVLRCIGEKNAHDISGIEGCELIYKLISCCGCVSDVLPVLLDIYSGKLSPAAKTLIDMVSALENNGYKNKVKIDFSVLNNMNYYSGLVFSGFVEGIPTSVLCGGQYDYLMKRLHRTSGAIGFAVYIDTLEQYFEDSCKTDTDTIILYETSTPTNAVADAVDKYLRLGTVSAVKLIPEHYRYERIVRLNGNGEETQ